MDRPIPKRFTEEEQAAIAARYAAGESRSQLAKSLGTKPHTVAKILKDSGVTMRPRSPRKFPPKVRAEIARRYETGEPSGNIAASFGTTISTVRNIAREHGVKINPRGQRYREFSAAELDEIRRLWEFGVAQTAIAERFGVGHSVMGNVMRRAGFTKERRPAVKEEHGGWKGGRIKGPDGYIDVRADEDTPFPSMVSRNGYIREHRLVMAEALGRPLESWEQVHHKDGDRTNNRLDNLQLRQGKHGKGVSMVCADCGSHNIVSTELAEP